MTRKHKKVEAGSITRRGKLSAKEIAAKSGISVQRVYVLLREGFSGEEIIATRTAKVAPGQQSGQRGADAWGSRPRTLAAARLVKETILGRLRQLDLLEREGALVNTARVAKYYGDKVICARDAFLRIPAELADRLAAETEAASVTRVLDEEIRRILEMLSTSGENAHSEATK